MKGLAPVKVKTCQEVAIISWCLLSTLCYRSPNGLYFFRTKGKKISNATLLCKTFHFPKHQTFSFGTTKWMTRHLMKIPRSLWSVSVEFVFSSIRITSITVVSSISAHRSSKVIASSTKQKGTVFKINYVPKYFHLLRKQNKITTFQTCLA